MGRDLVVQAVTREEGDGDGGAAAGGVVQDSDGRGGTAPGGCWVERGDGGEAWEGLQAGAANYGDGDGTCGGGVSIGSGIVGGVVVVVVVGCRWWGWQGCVPSYEFWMLAILRKPMCICRLKEV